MKLFYNIVSFFKKNEIPIDKHDNMINYLINKIEKVNLYKLFFNYKIETLEYSTKLLYKELKKINSKDFHKDLIMVKEYTMFKPLVIEFDIWYSNEGYLYNDNSLMKMLLEEIKIFIDKYNDENESSMLVTNKIRTEQILRCVEHLINVLYKKV
jgi:hypothetical protein